MNNDTEAAVPAQTKNLSSYTDDADAWLRLRHSKGLGNISAVKLLQHFGDIKQIFAATGTQLKDAGLNTGQINALRAVSDADIGRDMYWLKQPDHHLIPLTDARYPDSIRALDDAPPLLYVWGDPDYLNQPQLAMVGTRNPTAVGRNIAGEFARHLSDSGITITSGLASGIDGASHEGALAGLAGTIAVVAHGLDIVYPAEHQALAERISQHGAVISEMPVGTRLQRGLFPRRNRLISAISLGTLVVEAARQSGSLITARFALEQNREVFAIPGSIHNPQARGCHLLIRQGAKLVETANDILEELARLLGERLPDSSRQHTEYPQKADTPTHENPAESTLALDPDHQKLLKCLAHEPASVDELVASSGFSAAEVASMLLILELEGTILSQDGLFSRIK